MIIQIDLPEGSDELELFEDTVADVNKNLPPSKQVTIAQYAENIVMGWIRERIKNCYILYAQESDIDVLKSKLGKYKELKK